MTSDLRVLHVLDHSLPVVSGYSIRTHAILCGQRRIGVAPFAITSPKHGTVDGSDIIDGIEYLRLPARRTNGRSVPWLGECGLMMRLARRLAVEVSRRRIDLLHAHSPVLTALPALWAARRAGIPMVYEVRAFWEDAAVGRGTQTPTSPRYRVTRLLESWVLRRADAVAVISRSLRDELVQRGVPSSKIAHVPNGVDTTVFCPSAPDATLVQQHRLTDTFVVGFLGTFNSYEGLDILLPAFAKLLATVPHARLILVGDGEAQAAARADARRLDIESHLVFAGVVSPAEMPRWYSVCDVLAYPRHSTRDTELTTPLKPLEAMAMGKSVVASDVGGLRELIRNGETGLLCAPGDVDALAHVLMEIGQHPQRGAALGHAARRWVCEHRDWKRVVPMHAGLYQIALRRFSAAVAPAPDATSDPAFKAAE